MVLLIKSIVELNFIDNMLWSRKGFNRETLLITPCRFIEALN